MHQHAANTQKKMIDRRLPISVVIVTYNSIEFIDRCLAPIVGDPNIEILIVDNCSTDDTPNYVRRNHPGVRVLQTGENLGFAKGNNVGFTHCSFELVLLLNPDAFLESSSQIHDLADILEADPNIALVGPQLKNLDGSHQTGDAGWKDSVLSTAGHMLFLHRLVPAFPSLYVSNPHLMKKNIVDVDWVCGACILTRRSVITAHGGLDEKIFMYGEDVEWGERMRSAGRRVVYVPSVQVLHLQGATQRKRDERFYSTKWIDNRAAKHARKSLLSFHVFRLLCLIGFGLRFTIASIQAFGLKRPGSAATVKTMKRYFAHVAAWHTRDFVVPHDRLRS